jgi:hypothetical protein
MTKRSYDQSYSVAVMTCAIAMSISPCFAQDSNFFRLDLRDGRHVLLNPDGEPFVAVGVNHIGHVAGDRARFQQVYGGDWRRFGEELEAQFERWNMNCIGYGGPVELQSSHPYFATISLVPIEKHRSDPDRSARNGYHFPDIFEPAWAASIQELIRQLCARHRNSRMLIGYMWTDTPTWDLFKTRALRGTDWVSEIRRLPLRAAGRMRYNAFIRERYAQRLDTLNLVYGLELNSLDDLASVDLSQVVIGRHIVQEDDEAFLRIIARRFYTVAGATQRESDPHHLVFGDRYLVGDTPTVVLQEATPWIDAVAVQPGDIYAPLYPPSTAYPSEELQLIHQITQKPILICDHAISFPTEKHSKTIFEQMPTEATAASAIKKFLTAAFDERFVIGYLKCQYIDRPAGYGRGLRQGLLRADGSERTEITKVYSDVFGKVAHPAGSK